MAAAYTKEFLLNAFLSRYKEVLEKKGVDASFRFIKMASDFYDEVGKDKFRVYASLDAEAIKLYKQQGHSALVVPSCLAKAIELLGQEK